MLKTLPLGDDGLVLRSFDMGQTWKDISIPYEAHIDAIGIVGDTILIGTRGRATGDEQKNNAFYASYDNGLTWNLVSISGQHPNSSYGIIVNWPESNRISIANQANSGNSNGQFSSNDNGATFFNEGSGTANSIAAFDVLNSTDAYLISGGLVSKPTNALDSDPSNVFSPDDYKDVAKWGDTILVVGTTGIVSISIDNGSTFENLNDGLGTGDGQLFDDIPSIAF